MTPSGRGAQKFYNSDGLQLKDGVNYDKDSKGNPILPIFKLAAGETTRGGVEVPVFAKAGPVWKAEQTKEAAKK
jgi:hypothetical protein